MSGLQPLEEVRADTSLTKVVFVMVTTEKAENVAAAKAAGLSN
jgi:hypothetical protein